MVLNRLSIGSFAVAVVILTLLLGLTPASAQATRTWVSGFGDDANPCSRTAPCQTFAGAIAKTAVDGEINCLDPGDFGFVTITNPVTIDCHSIPGAIQHAGRYGIKINFDQFAALPRKTVNLRNLTLNGVSTGLAGIEISGNVAGTIVNIEDCLIDGDVGGSGVGILDERFRGALTVVNTTVRNMSTVGISIASPGADGSLRAMITDTRIYNSGSGIGVGVDGFVMLSHSVISGNLGIGVGAGSLASMVVDSTVIAHNGTGIKVASNATLRLSNSDLFLNSVGSDGTISTFENNRFSNNGTFGPLIPTGSTSNPTGQQ
jgi:parallel beta helix pectate lyase-like protein